MTYWKMKTGLTDGSKGDRELTLVIALYGPDKLPIARHMLSFCETDDAATVAARLHALASELETEKTP